MNVKLLELKKLQSNFPAKQITSSKESSDFIRQFYGDDIEIFESCFILLLNNNTTIGYAKISQGGISSTIVDVRIVAKYAIDSLATGVILCHNHPSGSIAPSHQDINLTEKLLQGLRILDIRLLDHVILTKDSYYSFSDNGRI
jgi:DNA repair protein RadC